jgi:NAD-dependent dihydropyrimidine dehydrogenase PreA subunit
LRVLRAAISGAHTESGKPGSTTVLDFPAGERWYPLVDAARCTQCRSCFQFCLFGVYALDGNQKVRVANPDQCKAGCPACSRICPHGAIMFALYEQDPAIAGAPGCFMKPDAAARRMFYLRTGRPCPVCGQAGNRAPRHKGPVCAECGRRTAQGAPAHVDELDRLIDGLEKLQQRNRST